MMDKQMVREWMTADPIRVDEKTLLTEAHDMMKAAGIRRLPVMRKAKVMGMLTIGDIRQALPSDVNSLSVYELNYLLNRITVKEIMSHDVISIAPEASMHAAAQLMLDHKIGGLPVLDQDGALVGIITEADVFRMVIALPEEG